MKTVSAVNKFTPGPWNKIGEGDNNISVGTETLAVCNIGATTAEAWADARLIAAAPDLLAALEMALDASQNCIGDVSWEDTAIAAVARARGQE